MPAVVAVLGLMTGVLFIFGALAHAGVPLGPLEEPVVVPAAVLEAVGALLLGVATVGVYAMAAWARLAALVAHGYGLAATVIVSALLALDGLDSTAGAALLQGLRAVLGAASVVLLVRPVREAARL